MKATIKEKPGREIMKEEKRKTISKKKKIIVFAVICAVLFVFFLYENKHLVVTEYTYTSEKVAEGLDGYRIVQVSDLHNTSFGIDNEMLLKKIEEADPDIIVITGDLVDSSFTNVEKALRFIDQITAICPVYYVTGNHEYWISEDALNSLLSGLEARGVYILSNESRTILAGKASFCLAGLDDRNLMDDTLKGILQGKQKDLTVVLAHEPQCFQNYVDSNADLVLTGHAHGGQFRIPGFGGVVAPDQGFHPKYTEGEFVDGPTTMLVCRGLGNSVIPVRLFNNPEIVCVELKNR